MTSNHHSLVARADAVADAVCLRRVLHAFLTMLAGWTLYGVLVHRSLIATEEPWWALAPVLITGLTTFFAIWAVFVGDRLVWLRAFRQAARVARRDR
jgi:hypothetical protein